MIPNWVRTLSPYARATFEWAPNQVSWDETMLEVHAAKILAEVDPTVVELVNQEPSLTAHQTLVQAEIAHLLPTLRELRAPVGEGEQRLLAANDWLDRPSVESLMEAADQILVAQRSGDDPTLWWKPTHYLPSELTLIAKRLGVADPYLVDES